MIRKLFAIGRKAQCFYQGKGENMHLIQFKIDSKFEQLIANGTNRNANYLPVMHLYGKTEGAIKPQWLLSELNPHNLTQAFGLCDRGDGFPKLDSVSMRELLERYQAKIDVNWVGHYPMDVYTEAAYHQRRITFEETHLQQAAVLIFYKKYGQAKDGAHSNVSQPDNDNMNKPFCLGNLRRPPNA